jgi:hypothetical protein
MLKKLTAAVLMTLATGTVSHAQDGWEGVNDALNAANDVVYGAMQHNALEMQRGQQAVAQMIQNRMNDPAVQQAYREHQANGSPYGQMSFYQFTYNYMATRGFSPDGIQHWNRVQRQINMNDANAMRNYLDSQRRHGQEMHDFRNQSVDRINEGRGDAITGNTPYYAPNGQQVYLPYTAQPGDSYVDQSGNTYMMTQHKYFVVTDPWGRTYRTSPVR